MGGREENEGGEAKKIYIANEKGIVFGSVWEGRMIKHTFIFNKDKRKP